MYLLGAGGAVFESKAQLSFVWAVPLRRSRLSNSEIEVSNSKRDIFVYFNRQKIREDHYV